MLKVTKYGACVRSFSSVVQGLNLTVIPCPDLDVDTPAADDYCGNFQISVYVIHLVSVVYQTTNTAENVK